MSIKKSRIRQRMEALPDVVESGMREALNVFAGKKSLLDATETVRNDAEAAELGVRKSKRISERGTRRSRRIS